MEEQLISFQTAVNLSAYYFDLAGESYYTTDEKLHTLNFLQDWSDLGKEGIKYVQAPSQSLVQRWLRENHRILVLVDYDEYARIGYTFKLCYGEYPNNKEVYSNGELRIFPFISYEKALEAGLLKALTLI